MVKTTKKVQYNSGNGNNQNFGEAQHGFGKYKYVGFTGKHILASWVTGFRGA
jgi:hypothetical protein